MGAALEALHGACSRAGTPACDAAIEEWFGPMDAPAPSGSAVAVSAWNARLAALVRTLMETARPLPALQASLSGDPAFASDPMFAADWSMAAKLVATANTVLAETARSSGGRATLAELLAPSPRLVVQRAVESVLESAVLPAIIGANHRGIPAEAESYLRATEPFAGSFVAARFARARARGTSREHEDPWNDLDWCVRSDPYHREAVNSWLREVIRRESQKLGGPSMNEALGWLASLEPRHPNLAKALANGFDLAGRTNEGIEVLDSALAHHPNRTDLIDYRDELRARVHRPYRERMTVYQEHAARAPRHVATQLTLARFHMRLGELDDAERMYRDLAKDRRTAHAACVGLANVLQCRGQQSGMRDQLESCVETADSVWSRVALLNRIGTSLRIDGDPKRALAWHEKAYGLVGPQYATVDSMVWANAAAGDTKRAEELATLARDRYPKADGGYEDLSILHLRAGDTAQALADLQSLRGLAHDTAAFEALRRAYRRAGDRGGFEALCREHRGRGSLLVLGRMYLEDLDDLPAAERTAAELIGAYPNTCEANDLMGRIRLAQGRPADAMIEFERALATRPDYPDVEVGRVRAALAAGEPERARELSYGNAWDGVRFLSRAARLVADLRDDRLAASLAANLSRDMDRIPEDYPGWVALAQLYSLSGFAREAEDAKKTARTWNPWLAAGASSR